DVMVRREGAKIVAAGIVLIEPHAPIARDAAVHLVVQERAEILIAVRALQAPIAAIVVARHHGHVLQVAFAAFLADRAVVRMVDHQPLDDAGAKVARLGLVVADPEALRRGRHARHHDAAFGVALVAVLLHRALPARADRAHRGMQAEVGQVQAERQAVFEQVLLGRGRMLAVVEVDRHRAYGAPSGSRRGAVSRYRVIERGGGAERRAHAPSRKRPSHHAASPCDALERATKKHRDELRETDNLERSGSTVIERSGGSAVIGTDTSAPRYAARSRRGSNAAPTAAAP